MSTIQIQTFTGGPVQTNGFLVKTEHACFVIDAPAGMAKFVLDSDLEPTHLLLTHQHFDHVEDAAALVTQGLKIFSHSDYDPTIIRDDVARSFGLQVNVPPFRAEQTLADHDILDVNLEKITLLYVPGHSPDSIAFYLPEHETVFGGDALFQRSIGRTDLPGGSHEQLITAIREKLLTLPENTRVHPGHGPFTSISEEKTQNPHL